MESKVSGKTERFKLNCGNFARIDVGKTSLKKHSHSSYTVDSYPVDHWVAACFNVWTHFTLRTGVWPHMTKLNHVPNLSRRQALATS